MCAEKKEKKSAKRERINKIYRTPPTPIPEILLAKEKTFVLDCNATACISSDYAKANPKLGPVIPPYNSQRDRHVDNYFTYHGVQRTLKLTGQDNQGHSTDGPIMDRFLTNGAGYHYLSRRNKSGAGNSRDIIDGHAQFMVGMKPIVGYNGRFGFRRNTPALRTIPSPFYPNCIMPTA